MDVPGSRRGCQAERGASEAGIDLYWLPLGAGGWFVRLNGRIYEAIRARVDGRPALDLYHSALEVRVPEGRFVIEVSWPIQDAEGASRGVVLEGPVGSRILAPFRVARYELRRWRNGVIPDVDEAVASPQRLTDDPVRARRVLDLVGSAPQLVWGRDETDTGGMWNSNSVISWLIARSGLPTDAIEFPAHGRAPGWEAGLVTARRHQRDARSSHDPFTTARSVRCGVDERVALGREEHLRLHASDSTFADLNAGRKRGKMPGEEGWRHWN